MEAGGFGWGKVGWDPQNSLDGCLSTMACFHVLQISKIRKHVLLYPTFTRVFDCGEPTLSVAGHGGVSVCYAQKRI